MPRIVEGPNPDGLKMIKLENEGKSTSDLEDPEMGMLSRWS